MSIRSLLKKIKLVWYAVQYLKLLQRVVKSVLKKTAIFLFYREDLALLKEMRTKVKLFYPLGLGLKNIGGFPQYYHGKNVLGYPGMSFLEKDGVNVGMSEGKITVSGEVLPIIQLKTDMEINFRNLFFKFKPCYIVDFGTSSGGSAIFFYQLMQEYTNPRLLTIDISDVDFNNALAFHTAFKTREKIRTILNKSSLDCKEEVKEFLSARQAGERVLFSFDDLHTYEHTYKELVAYAPLLQSGDIILMQDTWNQGLLGHETSPMLAVYRFLKEKSDWKLNEEFCKNMVLPCNFIYGVIIKK